MGSCALNDLFQVSQPFTKEYLEAVFPACFRGNNALLLLSDRIFLFYSSKAGQSLLFLL